ncbi:MAG TPA: Zn-dependent hydrolase [Pseudogracilibacillus sp.]|nr:Zn-dependent hydrolase [Pseudogracilibacillus sp.]
MKQLTLESREFQRILKNLHLENLSLSEKNQKKIINIVNNNTTITSTMIKDLFRNGEI